MDYEKSEAELVDSAIFYMENLRKYSEEWLCSAMTFRLKNKCKGIQELIVCCDTCIKVLKKRKMELEEK